MPNILYGDIWYGDLDPTVGHEQAGQRPMLVISPSQFNNGPLKLALVLPITTNLRPLPSRVSIVPPEGGLTRPSIILCEGIRSVSHDRLERRRHCQRGNHAKGSGPTADIDELMKILMSL